MRFRLVTTTASSMLFAAGLAVAGEGKTGEYPYHTPEDVTEIEDEFQSGIMDAGGVYISGQPSEQALQWCVENGVTTVICLRGQNELDNRDWVKYDMKAYVEELGLEWVHAPMAGRSYGPEVMDIVAEGIAGAEGKVLLCCTVGWRASHVWGAYLVNEYHWSPGEAYELILAMTESPTPFERLLAHELTFSWADQESESH